MICDRIKQLREPAGYSQAQLAKLFQVSADYLLGLTASSSIVLDGYMQEEIELLYKLIRYFDDQSTKRSPSGGTFRRTGIVAFLLFLFLFHAALNVLQSPQAQPGGGAEEQRAKRKLLFLHVDILMCRFRVKQRLR